MKGSTVKWILIGLVVLIAIMTCPDQQDHREAIQKELVGDAVDSSDALASAIGGLFVGAVLEGTLNVKNYLLFSVGKINNPFTGESKTVSWGLFGHVFVKGD